MSLEHWVWFSTLQIDKRTMHRLLYRFADPQRIYEATESELRETGLGEAARKAVSMKRNLNYARDVISYWW